MPSMREVIEINQHNTIFCYIGNKLSLKIKKQYKTMDKSLDQRSGKTKQPKKQQ